MTLLVTLAAVTAVARRGPLHLVAVRPVDAVDDHAHGRAQPGPALGADRRRGSCSAPCSVARPSGCSPSSARALVGARSTCRPPPRSASPRCCALVAAAMDLGIGTEMPHHRRQVNEVWLDQYRSWVYGMGFGWQIGTGLSTYIMTAAVYLTVVLAALTGVPCDRRWRIAVLFGLTRGLAILLGVRLTDPERLRSLPPALRRRSARRCARAVIGAADGRRRRGRSCGLGTRRSDRRADRRHRPGRHHPGLADPHHVGDVDPRTHLIRSAEAEPPCRVAARR